MVTVIETGFRRKQCEAESDSVRRICLETYPLGCFPEARPIDSRPFTCEPFHELESAILASYDGRYIDKRRFEARRKSSVLTAHPHYSGLDRRGCCIAPTWTARLVRLRA